MMLCFFAKTESAVQGFVAKFEALCVSSPWSGVGGGGGNRLVLSV